MLVEEHLSSDGVREPEGRGDRQDIEIVGRVRILVHDITTGINE